MFEPMVMPEAGLAGEVLPPGRGASTFEISPVTRPIASSAFRRRF
jgi:hypothetical protein